MIQITDLFERIKKIFIPKRKCLIIFSMAAVFPVIILAGSLTGCGNDQLVDEYSNGSTIQIDEDSNGINNDDNESVSGIDRFAIDEAEWPWGKDLVLKYPEYTYSISWYADQKENLESGKEYYGIGYYLELKESLGGYANIFEEPSFSAKVVGELHSEEKLSCWPEKYQTEYDTNYGYYYLW